jgi:hypothetical protein
MNNKIKFLVYLKNTQYFFKWFENIENFRPRVNFIFSKTNTIYC